MSVHAAGLESMAARKRLTVLVSRPADQLTEFAARASKENVRVIPFPLSRIVPLVENYGPGFIRNEIDKSAWIFLTSANAVAVLFSSLEKHRITIPQGVSLAAIGKRTAAAIESYGYRVALSPSDEVAEGLLQEFLSRHASRDKQLMIPAAEQIRPILETGLFEAGYAVKKLDIYRNEEIPATELSDIKEEKIDYYCFLSSSAVDRYNELFGNPQGLVVSIGRITTGTMKSHGWENIKELPSADLNSFWEIVDA